MITQNVEKLLAETPRFNPYGEPVTVLAAVKTQPVEAINEAIRAGISVIGDNHVQEFRDKYACIQGSPQRHFIGRLQTNKIKYLLGRCDLYHSVDRLPLAEALNQKSLAAGIVSNVLLEVNAGGEESKGGFAPDELLPAYRKIKEMTGLKILGLMAMLPLCGDEEVLRPLALSMRAAYDGLRADDPDIRVLSMGMSGDWKLCVECGSNLIRVGTSIFGPRH